MKKMLLHQFHACMVHLTRNSVPVLFFFSLLLPTIFFPKISNAYTYPKIFLLIGTTAVLSINLVAKYILQKKVVIPQEKLVYIFLFFTFVSISSLVIIKSDIFTSLTAPIGVITITMLGIITWILFLIRDADHRQSFIWGLCWGSFLLNLLGIYIVTNGSIPGISNPTIFTPTGSPYSPLLVNLLSGMYMLVLLFQSLKQKEKKRTFLLLIMIITTLIGSLHSMNIVSTTSPFLLNPADGISIMTKMVTTSPWGSGIGNYIDAYTLFRPQETNGTPLWNFRFTIGPNTIIHIITVLGYVGGVFFLLYIMTVLWYLLRGFYQYYTFPVACTLFYILFFPPDILSVTLFVVNSIIFLSEYKKETITISSKKLPYTLFPITLIFFFGLLFKSGAYIIADWYQERALFMASNKAFTTALTLIDVAIILAPESPQYRQTASTIGITHAFNQAGIPSLSDTEKQTILKTFDYAIDQTKQLLMLAPNRSTSWQHSGFVYQQLTMITPDALQWSMNHYKEARKRDPINPELSFILGELAYSSKKYPEAIQYFHETIRLKPDYTAVYIPLANALLQIGKTKEAEDTFLIANTLLPADAPERRELPPSIQK